MTGVVIKLDSDSSRRLSILWRTQAKSLLVPGNVCNCRITGEMRRGAFPSSFECRSGKIRRDTFLSRTTVFPFVIQLRLFTGKPHRTVPRACERCAVAGHSTFLVASVSTTLESLPILSRYPFWYSKYFTRSFPGSRCVGAIFPNIDFTVDRNWGQSVCAYAQQQEINSQNGIGILGRSANRGPSKIPVI
jgi:hypothetical protein